MNKFDSIRPYTDTEIHDAMQRIAASRLFPLLSSYIYPDKSLEDVKATLISCNTISDFQSEVMFGLAQRVMARSIVDFTYTGLERLDPSRSYLFISNHRDITLDSCLLEYVLYTNGHQTTQITFGSNLMCNPLVVDIGKSNKMFRVERGGNIKDFYKSSKLLSEYIRHVITEKHQGVWIAQRNGRTKDGNDITEQGIIKMFCMSCQHDKIKALADLNIVPVAISYEWEPCDILKTIELYESSFTKYIKKPGEDINSILTGIVQRKGRVNIEICEPLTYDKLQQFAGCTNSGYHRKVAALIDSSIHSAYKLMPNNYIAHDIRYGQHKYRHLYTAAQKITFLHRLDKLNVYDSCDVEALKDIFLGIYSNPVENFNK